MSTLIKVADHRIETRKRIPLSINGDVRPGGFTTVADGFLVGDLVIEVDAAQLARLIGGKAIKSKSHKTVLQGGAVTIRATNIRHVQA